MRSTGLGRLRQRAPQARMQWSRVSTARCSTRCRARLPASCASPTLPACHRPARRPGRRARSPPPPGGGSHAAAAAWCGAARTRRWRAPSRRASAAAAARSRCGGPGAASGAGARRCSRRSNARPRPRRQPPRPGSIRRWVARSSELLPTPEGPSSENSPGPSILRSMASRIGVPPAARVRPRYSRTVIAPGPAGGRRRRSRAGSGRVITNSMVAAEYADFCPPDGRQQVEHENRQGRRRIEHRRRHPGGQTGGEEQRRGDSSRRITRLRTRR